MFVILQRWSDQKDQTIMMESDDEQELRRIMGGLKKDAVENKTPIVYEFKEIKGVSAIDENSLVAKAKKRGAKRIILTQGKIYDDTQMPEIRQEDM